MKESPTDIAWAAGIIDGEGCIYIARSQYSLYVKVVMAHKPSIEKLASIFGVGKVSALNRRQARWSVPWSWLCSTKAAIVVLEKTLPFLVAKKKEAALGLKFAALPKGHGGRFFTTAPKTTQRKRGLLYQQMRNLKTRGKAL